MYNIKHKIVNKLFKINALLQTEQVKTMIDNPKQEIQLVYAYSSQTQQNNTN